MVHTTGEFSPLMAIIALQQPKIAPQWIRSLVIKLTLNPALCAMSRRSRTRLMYSGETFSSIRAVQRSVLALAAAARSMLNLSKRRACLLNWSKGALHGVFREEDPIGVTLIAIIAMLYGRRSV